MKKIIVSASVVLMTMFAFLACDRERQQLSPQELSSQVNSTNLSKNRVIDDGGSISLELYERMFTNKEFVEALEILEENNESIDIKNGEMVIDEENNISILFKIHNIEENPVEYFSLVYSESKGKEGIVYFDDKNENFKEIEIFEKESKNGRNKIFGCKWSSWSEVSNSSYCANNWWCGKKNNREATYYWETRYKCEGGTRKKEQGRRCKRHCGC